MTIDLLTFRHLLEINRDYPNIRNVLVLGRQHFLSPNPDERTKRQMTVYQRMLEQFEHDLKIENLSTAMGFVIPFLIFLGSRQRIIWMCPNMKARMSSMT